MTLLRGRGRIVLGPFRLFVVSVALLTIGGFAAIIYLGPNNVRWLTNGGVNRAAAHRLWNYAPEGIPADFLAGLRRGVIAAREGRRDEAVEALSAAIAANVNANTLETLGTRAQNSLLPETHLWRLDIQARIERADALRILGRYGEALQDVEYAVRLNNRDYETRELRGVMLMMVDRGDDAIAEFNTLLGMRASGRVLFARGLAKYLKHDWSGAAQDFTRASELTPRNRKYAAWLADAQSRIKLPDDVVIIVQQDQIYRTVYTRGSPPDTLPPRAPSEPPSGKAAGN